MPSFFLSVWKKTQHVPFEGGIQVGQAENGGVGAQKGGEAGRKDREHRGGRSRPCVGVTGRSVWLEAATQGQAGEGCGVLPAPPGPNKPSLGYPAHPAGLLRPVTDPPRHVSNPSVVTQTPVLCLCGRPWHPGSQTSVFGSGPWLVLCTQACCLQIQFMGQCLSLRQEMQIGK